MYTYLQHGTNRSNVKVIAIPVSGKSIKEYQEVFGVFERLKPDRKIDFEVGKMMKYVICHA